ncbi:MAG: SHOCT domain-containing protein [Ilumatobacteraceae bacterium]|jgi:hypothetical protein
MESTNPLDGAPAGFSVMFIGVGIFIGLVLILVIVSLVKNFRVMKARGVDPLTAHGEIAARMAKGTLFEGKSIEQKLSELDDLRKRGVITDVEHADSRRRILGG